MKPQFIATAARLGNALEYTLSALRTGRASRAPRLLRVIAYRSLGTATSLTVRGRLVIQASSSAHPPRNGSSTSQANLVAVYRAFDVADVMGANVTVSCDSVCARTTTDDGGFFETDLPCPKDGWDSGWHSVDVRAESTGAIAHAQVFVPDAHAQLLIVSDLDDTAMDTETIRSWRMLRTVLFRSAEQRQPVPGVPQLYQALHAGRGIANPVCYISSGAWNLYDPVLEYLDTHGLPRGAVLLNDWGSRERRFRAVAHQHKGAHISSLISRFPSLPLLLIGDDTQEDPELYAEAVRKHPGRVGAIWIRAVRPDAGRAAEVRTLQRSVHATGTEFAYAPTSDVFMQHARQRGWICDQIG